MASGRLNPVAWTEGMFLRPQHFQQHDLYLEERLRYHLQTLNPYHWGVRQLSINEDQLTSNMFEIQQFEAIMPGGTIVRTGDNAVVHPRSFDPSNERIAVYIAMRRVSDSEAGTTAEQGESEDARFQIMERDLPDRTRAGAVAPVDLAFPNLQVFFSGQEKDLELHEYFKLADIVATGEKRRFELAQDYCPPLLTVQAFPPLFDRISQIVAQIKAKVIVVSGRTSGTLAVAELPKYWMRYTLARVAPLLDHLLATGMTDPFALYTALVDAAGALAAFNLQEPAELPLYRHDDLMGCFGQLALFLDDQLSEAVPDRFVRVDLGFDDDKKLYYSNRLNTDIVAPHNFYYLAIKADLEAQDLVDRVTSEAKAGAHSTVKLGLRANLAGVPVEHLEAPPTEVELLPGYQYFSLDPHHGKWKKVQEDFDFALSLPNVESADVRLYVVKGER